MNRKQFLISLVLVVVLGAAGWMIYQKQQGSWKSGESGAGKKLLGDLPINDVAAIDIGHGTNEVHLVKTNDVWRVRERANYSASFSEIRDLLRKLVELKSVQTEQVGASQLPRLHLTPTEQGSNAPVVVQFLGAGGKSLQTLLLGKLHMKTSARSSGAEDEEAGGFPDGRYVKLASSTEVALIADPLESVEPKPESWLDKDFFKIEKPKSIEVIHSEATNSWKLVRDTETAEWKLADVKADEKLDSGKTGSVTSPFSSASFTDVLPGNEVAANGTNQPVKVNVETFDGFDYAIKIGGKTNDDYPLTVGVTAQLPKERTAGANEKPEDKAKFEKEFQTKQQQLADKLKQEQSFENWTYLVPGWEVEPVLKNRSELLVEKETPKENENTNVPEPTAKSP